MILQDNLPGHPVLGLDWGKVIHQWIPLWKGVVFGGGEYQSNDEWQRIQKHQLTIARWHTVTMIHWKMIQVFSFEKPIYPLISRISGALCAKDSSSIGKYESSLAPKSLCPAGRTPRLSTKFDHLQGRLQLLNSHGKTCTFQGVPNRWELGCLFSATP